MLGWPGKTAAHRPLPKNAFYNALPLTTALKDKFVGQIDRIYIENVLSSSSLNLAADPRAAEIDLLSIALKGTELDGKLLEAVARQNPHRLVFLLMSRGRGQLALCHHGKLYRTPWTGEAGLVLELRRQSMDDIWVGFVEQIALRDERAANVEGLSLDERLALQARIEELERLIARLEAAKAREKQPHKRYDLHTKIRQYRHELEVLTHGKA